MVPLEVVATVINNLVNLFNLSRLMNNCGNDSPLFLLQGLSIIMCSVLMGLILSASFAAMKFTSFWECRIHLALNFTLCKGHFCVKYE